MKLALSFCPNDTFIFYAWIHGKLGLPLEPTFADLNDLNPWALEGRFELIKLSCAAYRAVASDYWFLPVGAALGFGCGPKIIAKPGMTLETIRTIVVPGRLTTANLLLDQLLKLPAQRGYCRYDAVCDLVAQGAYDAGVIIHETRFTYQQWGLIELIDLGKLWETTTSLPLPLGGIALRRDHPDPATIVATLRGSIEYAFANPEETLPFILSHSAEKERAVVLQHVATYVNQESLSLSDRGIQALETLFALPKKTWLPL